MTTHYRYVGPGTYAGVPDRTIAADEFERMHGEHRRVVLLSGAYEPMTASAYEDELAVMKREELDELALAADLVPSDYKTKADLVRALVDIEEGN